MKECVNTPGSFVCKCPPLWKEVPNSCRCISEKKQTDL